MDVSLIRYCTFHRKGDQTFIQNLICLAPEFASPRLTQRALRVVENFRDPDLLTLGCLHRPPFWVETFCTLNYIDIDRVVEGTTALIAARILDWSSVFSLTTK